MIRCYHCMLEPSSLTDMNISSFVNNKGTLIVVYDPQYSDYSKLASAWEVSNPEYRMQLCMRHHPSSTVSAVVTRWGEETRC